MVQGSSLYPVPYICRAGGGLSHGGLFKGSSGLYVFDFLDQRLELSIMSSRMARHCILPNADWSDLGCVPSPTPKTLPGSQVGPAMGLAIFSFFRLSLPPHSFATGAVPLDDLLLCSSMWKRMFGDPGSVRPP
jgi:hypothetical protein